MGGRGRRSVPSRLLLATVAVGIVGIVVSWATPSRAAPADAPLGPCPVILAGLPCLSVPGLPSPVPPPAPPQDAGPQDAGPQDAGPQDAGPQDPVAQPQPVPEPDPGVVLSDDAGQQGGDESGGEEADHEKADQEAQRKAAEAEARRARICEDLAKRLVIAEATVEATKRLEREAAERMSYRRTASGRASYLRDEWEYRIRRIENADLPVDRRQWQDLRDALERYIRAQVAEELAKESKSQFHSLYLARGAADAEVTRLRGSLKHYRCPKAS